MSNPADKLVTNRMSDSTDLGDVDDGVNNLEAALRTIFGIPADTAVTPMSVDGTGAISFNQSIGFAGSSVRPVSIVSSIPEDGVVNELASVDAIRNYVLAHAGGGGGFEFSAGQEYGSLWVSSTLGLAVGFPAYWQIVSRAPSGGESTFQVTSAGDPSNFTSLEWTHTLREHPALEADSNLRPVQTHLSPSMFSFPCKGLWHLELVLVVQNFNGLEWAPLQYQVSAGPPILYLQPAWTAQLVKLGSPDHVLDIHISPHQGSVHRFTTGADYRAQIHYTTPTPALNGTVYAQTAVFNHTLHLNRTFYVEYDMDDPVPDVFEIQLQQMSGGTITLVNENLKMVLRHIPTNGG